MEFLCARLCGTAAVGSGQLPICTCDGCHRSLIKGLVFPSPLFLNSTSQQDVIWYLVTHDGKYQGFINEAGLFGGVPSLADPFNPNSQRVVVFTSFFPVFLVCRHCLSVWLTLKCTVQQFNQANSHRLVTPLFHLVTMFFSG